MKTNTDDFRKRVDKIDGWRGRDRINTLDNYMRCINLELEKKGAVLFTFPDGLRC